MVLVYAAVFGLILEPSVRPDTFVAALVIGLSVYQSYAASTTIGTNVLSSARGLSQSTAISCWSLFVANIVEIFVRTLPFVIIFFHSRSLFWSPPDLELGLDRPAVSVVTCLSLRGLPHGELAHHIFSGC